MFFINHIPTMRNNVPLGATVERGVLDSIRLKSDLLIPLNTV